MNLRMGYINIPIDYIRELKSNAKRDKARAFMEYFDDMDSGSVNAFSFYAKSWGVSKSTAHDWVKEFKDEIDKFFGHWTIKNAHHYHTVKNLTERQPNDNRTQEGSKTPTPSAQNETSRTTTERQQNEAFNIDDGDDSAQKRVKFFDAKFEDLFMRARICNKKVGSKEEAYKEYITNHQHVSHNDIAYAYMVYANDPQINGKVFNLVNFLKNQVYMSYLMPRIRVTKNGQVFEGWYEKDKNLLKTDSNEYWEVKPERFNELVARGEIVILPKMKAAV